MKITRRHKGSTLVLAMLCILVFMTLIMGFAFDTRTQSVMNTGVKLNTFYQVSAEQVLQEIRANLADYWVASEFPEEMNRWRFGALLQGEFSSVPGNHPENGILFSQGSTTQNAGLLTLYYRVWVTNNADDPAYFMCCADPPVEVGQDDEGQPLYIGKDWDTDGKIVLTTEIFESDTYNMPLITISHMVAVSGSQRVASYGNPGVEASDLEGKGSGDMGGSSSLSLNDSLSQIID